MSSGETNLIFPQRLIPTLLESRGEDWKRLVADTLDGKVEKTDLLSYFLDTFSILQNIPVIKEKVSIFLECDLTIAGDTIIFELL